MNKSIIAGLVVSSAIVGGSLALKKPQPPIEQVIAPISVNGKQITFDYSDDNTGEDILLYTDLDTYNSWDSVYSYFAAKNTTGKDQNVQFQCFFAGTEQCEDIEEFKPHVAHKIDVPDYGKQACEFNDFYKRTLCSNVQTGTHTETLYQDEWGKINPKAIEDFEAKDPKKIKDLQPKDQFEFWIPAGETKYFRTVLKFQAGKLGEQHSGKFALKAFGHKGAYGSLDPTWYSGSWGYRKSITIDYTKLGTTTPVTNFPVLLNTGTTSPPTEFKYTGSGGHVGKSDGTDFVITESDGVTKLNHEIEKYSSTTGETVIWFKTGSTALSTSTNTTYYIYYGNSGASDQQNITGVWDANYQEVYHFATDSTNSLLGTDSTSNGRTQTMFNMTARQGQVAGGAYFNGSNAYSSSTLPTTGNSAATTISFWSYVVSGEQQVSAAFDFGNGAATASNRALSHAPWSDSTLYWDYGNATGGQGRVSTSYSSFLSKWTLVDLVYNNTSTTHSIYFNGVLQTSNVSSNNPTTLTGLMIGKNIDGNHNYHKGIIDDFRHSNIARDASWILTEYNNQSSPSTFYTLGAEEAGTTVVNQLTRVTILGNNSGYGSENPQLINQATISSSLTTTATTTISTPTAGNTLILGIGLSSTSTVVSSVTGGGATWTRALTSSNNRDVETWYGVSNGTNNLVTVTFNNASSASAGNISEWRGVGGVAQMATSTGNSTLLVSGNVTNTTPNVLLYAHVRSATGTASGTPTNSFTQLTTPVSGTWEGAYRLPNANSTYSTTWEVTVAKLYDTNMVVFLPASRNTRMNIINGRLNIPN